jgi:hypothetical protein
MTLLPAKRNKETAMAAKPKSEAAKNFGPIRVTLPLSVAFDLDKFHHALTNVARLVGGAARTSGVDVTFQHMREFVVDPASLQAREAVQQ